MRLHWLVNNRCKSFSGNPLVKLLRCKRSFFENRLIFKIDAVVQVDSIVKIVSFVKIDSLVKIDRFSKYTVP